MSGRDEGEGGRSRLHLTNVVGMRSEEAIGVCLDEMKERVGGLGYI